MPSFTIPKDTPITVTQGVVTVTENFGHEPVYVTWEDNRKQRTMKLKQTCEPVCIPNFPSLEGIYESFYLDTLTNSVPTPVPQCIPATWDKDACKKKIKEHNMSNNIYATAASVNSTVPTDQKQRDYTLGRLSDLKREKLDELRKTFGLEDDDAPQSFTEFTARIKDGKFVFPKDRADSYNSPMDILYIIRWRDPAVKEDEIGYKAAKVKLEEALTTARDTVVLSAADQGLKIIEDFKSLKLS